MGKEKKNTHKFVSFTERISKLRIDVVHKIEKRSETPDKTDTFFQQCLSKWTEINCSMDFQEFTREVSALVKSLSLLVYHKKTVIEILQRYLKKRETLALDALLELCVELSRDLQCDFCPHFPEFLRIIAAHLDTKDAQKIEDCFKALAYLFKFQWRYLVKDIRGLFRSYSTLLSGNQQTHIQQFAAESFAFLIRKTKDLSGLFDEIICSILEKPQLCPGVGRLFVESVRGVQNQFHSCTEKILTTLLSKLHLGCDSQNGVSEHDAVEKILRVFVCMFNEMAKCTRKEHTRVVWDCLEASMNRVLCDNADKDSSDCSWDELKMVVQLTSVWTEWRNGALIFSPVQIYKIISSLIDQTSTIPGVRASLLSLLSFLLLANCPELQGSYEEKLLHQVYTSSHFSVSDICLVTRRLKPWFHFTEKVLPKLVSCVEVDKLKSLDSNEISEILFMLAEIVQEKASFDEGFDESVTDNMIPLTFPKLAAGTSPDLLMKLFQIDWQPLSENVMETVWAALVCLPFVRPLNVERVLSFIQIVISHLGKRTRSVSTRIKVLFILSQAIKCVSLLCKFHKTSLEETLSFEELLDLIREYPCDVHVLQACHVYLSVIREQESSSAVLSSQSLLQVYPYLEKNLSSHEHLVRLMTLKILTSLDQINGDKAEDITSSDTVRSSVFSACLEAELVPLTFGEYRRKLILLQKLVYPNTRKLPAIIKEAPLRYLIGVLYVNLSTMWDPVMSIITTYTVEENKKFFWDVFHEYLTQASSDAADIKTDTVSDLSSSVNAFFHRCLKSCVGPREDNRVDHQNFRLLLWKLMARFPQIVEPRSRQVVPLFLEFLRKECSVIDEACKVSHQDLTTADYCPADADEGPIEDNEDPIEDDECPIEDSEDPLGMEEDRIKSDDKPAGAEDEVQNGKREKRKLTVDREARTTSSRPVRMKTLSACLTVFSLFRNPMKLFQESTLRQLYLTLLTQKDGDIQKLGMTCLMTYKLDYLLPYKENLHRLLEDKTFRDELVCFSSNEELNIVSKDHRTLLMPILIRILYGKMQRWTGARTRGKAGSTARRSLVLRFLNSCHGDEMKVFVDLITSAFKEISDDDILDVVQHSLSRVVPLRKQIGFLNMFFQVIQLLGSHASQYLPRLLQVLFYCLKISKDALEQREKVERRYLSSLKAVRQLGLKCLANFFDAFPHYDADLIADNTFNLAVWPQIRKLSSESLQSPTALLRLLHVWSKNPRVHTWLSRALPGSANGLLVHVFACLASDHVQSPVVTTVMEIAERLLSCPGSDCESDSKLVCVDFESSSDVVSSGERVPHGTRLVLPHVCTLLEYLSKSIKKTSKDLAKAKGKLSKISAVSKLELSVLSKISPFVVDADHSLVLVRLMVPILNSTRKEEAQVSMLRSIANLLKNVADPAVVLTPLSRLFSTLHQREARSELCNVFSSIAEKSEIVGEDEVSLLHALNSWSQKHLDEPDYEARLEAFSQASKLVQDRELSAEVLTPFLLNATYFALRTSDMALRYSAVGFIRAVVERVSNDDSGSWFDALVLGCLLPATREAVKSKQEGARNEFVLVLGSLVKRFNHPLLDDLKPLTSNDPEVDFFENIVHIQVHRRIRALRKFSSACAETSFSAHTLSFLILPLVTHFIFEYKLAKDHNVVTEAISAISAISRQQSWPKYSKLLRHYLKILPREKEMQKVLVRIVVCILESFHFDLTTLKDSDIEAAEDIKDVRENDEDHDEEDQNEEEKLVECPLKLKLKINYTITTRILPQLHKCLTKKIDSGDFHRLSGRKEDDDEEILRVPIILAMVKLLQSLPKKTLQTNLPGLLIRVCQALKSHSYEVRETARATLSKITNSLGIYYFPFILNELKSSLIKGYQLHVLGSSLHYILTKFEEHIPDGGLDVSVQNIVQVLIKDLFGEPAREREVDKIATKLPEARSSKSFESFELLAKKITAAQLMAIVSPLKEVLDETQSHKTSVRVEEVLRRISIGLQKNPLFSSEQMLVFVHGLISERLSLLGNHSRVTEDDLKDQDPRLQSSDTYIIPPKPSRAGRTPEINHKTNAHVLITFGLQMLLIGLKRQKLVSSEETHIKMLDPFVALLSDALQSEHVKITTLTLRCLCLVVKYPLPSLKSHVLEIASQLFKLLKLHARTGGASGDNYEMVLSAFKTITVIIRDFKELKVTDRQLRILLTFVEEDIHDYTRQSSAFPLLKAILSRKLQVSEVNDVMLKVAELSVTDNLPSVRLQCRQVLLQFLLDYPLGKKLRRYLEFFVSQLEYEHASGRESTLEMIITIISSFPEKVIYNYSGLFFLPLCTRLVNDEATNCRKLTAVTIKELLGKLDVERRDNLFSIVLTWMGEEKLSLQRLACHVCGLFVEVEAQSFHRRLSDVFSSLFDIIKLENFEKVTTGDDVSQVKHQETLKDHLLINALMTLMKILQECSVLKGGKTQMTAEAWDSIAGHLLFPHTWVRLMASRLFGLLFAQRKPEEIIRLSREKSSAEYLAVGLRKKVFALCEAFLDQLKTRHLGHELGEQIVKNLFYLSKVILLMNTEKSNDESRGLEQLRHHALETQSCDFDDEELTLSWLLNTMCNIAKHEASQTPKLNEKRLCVLRWIAAVGSHLGHQQILPYLIQMLGPVYRELDGSATYHDEKVRDLSQEVAELFKNLVGREAFSLAYSNTKQTASEAKEKRKAQNAFEAVANPEASIAKKIKRNIAKKESRKRKLDAKKPARQNKKQKVT